MTHDHVTDVRSVFDPLGATDGSTTPAALDRFLSWLRNKAPAGTKVLTIGQVRGATPLQPAPIGGGRVAADQDSLRIARLSLTRRAFAVSRSSKVKSTARRGTVVKYTLSEKPASVGFRIERRTGKRYVKGRDADPRTAHELLGGPRGSVLHPRRAGSDGDRFRQRADAADRHDDRHAVAAPRLRRVHSRAAPRAVRAATAARTPRFAATACADSRPAVGRRLRRLEGRANGFAAPAPETTGEPPVADRVRLRLDYDERYLDWVFAELEHVTGLGRSVARLVRARGGRVLGWYVYYLLPHGSARVLQVAAPARAVGRVLDHLLHDAWIGGAAAVRGRLEPRLLKPVASQRCLTIYRGGALLHTRDREIIGAIASGDGLLTRLDGEWWLQDQAVDLGG